MSNDVPLEAKKTVRDKLESGNQRSYDDLREKTEGRFTMDTSDMRRELFIDKMVEWGIVTEDQMIEFDIEFHEKVEEALDGAWIKVKEAEAEDNKPKLSVVQKPKLLFDKHGKPLS